MDKIIPNSWRVETKPDFFCPGCGHGIILKQLGYAFDDLKIENKTTFGIDIGCSLLAWNFFNIDTIQTHHGRTTPVMVGYKMSKPERVAIAYMGDGGGYAIGLQSLIYACFRNNPITVILVNNGNYAMTGGQMAPTTMAGEITPTTPDGNPTGFGEGFKGPELLAGVAKKNAYIARTTVSKPLILRSILKKALRNQIDNKAFSFVEILSICPTNWKLGAKQSFSKLADVEEFYVPGEFPIKEQDAKN